MKEQLQNFSLQELTDFLIKQLDENILQNESKYKEFLAYISGFRSQRYSLNNKILLYIQAAERSLLSVFGTFNEWNERGTSIKGGETGLTICRPIFVDYYEVASVDKETQEIKATKYYKSRLTPAQVEHFEELVRKGQAEKGTELKSFTFVNSAFSLSQTIMNESERIEYLQRYNPLNTSTQNEGLYAKLKSISGELGRLVEERVIDNEALGWVEVIGSKIVIDAKMPVDAKVSVLFHEIGHTLLHIQNATAQKGYQKEVQAQLFSHLCMLRMGIDAEKQFSLKYINGYLRAYLQQQEMQAQKVTKGGESLGERELSRGALLLENLTIVLRAVDQLQKVLGSEDEAISSDELIKLKELKLGEKEEKTTVAESPTKTRKSAIKDLLEIEPLRVFKTTEKAVLVKPEKPESESKGIWLPRSQIEVDKSGFVIKADRRLVESKGLALKATRTQTKQK